MEQYIIVYSRYAVTLFMLLYALLSLYRVSAGGRPGSRYVYRSGERRACDNLMSVLIFLIQFIVFLTICVEKGTADYLFFYCLSQIVLFASMALFLMIYPEADRLLLNNMSLLLGCGFMILTRLDLHKAVKQLVIAALSIAVSMAVPLVMKNCGRSLRRMSALYAGIGITALGAVLALGQVTHGSRISLQILGFTFQPSEFVKLLFVLCMASLLWRDTSLKRLSLAAVIGAAHVLILVLSRDLGSALIFYTVFVFLVFLATGKYRYLLFGTAGGAGAALVAYRLFSHVQVRVQAWRDPWSVIDSQGYQITQSLFAISRGSWFGLGIGQGTPKDIPFVETDFIFAAVTEEMGILFGVCLLLVCISCFLVCIRRALVEEDFFYRLVFCGLGILYLFQIFLTVGGGTRFIPLTGVTLPFVSYGGSSVMTSILLFAMLQGCILRQEERTARAEWEGAFDEEDFDEEEYDPSFGEYDSSYEEDDPVYDEYDPSYREYAPACQEEYDDRYWDEDPCLEEEEYDNEQEEDWPGYDRKKRR